MASLGAQSSVGELFQVLTDVYRCFLGGLGPEPSCRDVAVRISSGMSGRVPGEDTRSSWELISISLSLVKKLSWSLVLQNLPVESAVHWDEVLVVLLEELGLMSQLVQLLRAEDQLVSHLAAKTASVCVLHLLRKSGEVSPVWKETCVQAFSSSCPPVELDACLWSLTEVLKKLRKGPDPVMVGHLVSWFDLSLRSFCSKLLSPHRTEPGPCFTFRRSWETTFCLLLDLLEVLTASRLIVAPELCQRPPPIQFSALLTAISCSSQDFVKNRALLLLKRVLLQEVGDDWSLGGRKSGDLNPDLRVLAQSVLAAVTDGWLQTVQLEPGGFFGGTRAVRGEAQKPGGVMLRAVSLILLKSTELHVQTLDAAGMDSVSEVCGDVHRLWDFLEGFCGSLRVQHLCCWIHLLFEDQDDDLMEALRTFLSLFLISRRCSGLDEDDDGTVLKRACGSGFNPHCHFILLLQNVSFDHSVLLDFLISSETCFLEYFVRYLKYLRGSWPGFTAACGSRTEPYNNWNQDKFPTGASEHVRLMEGLGSGPGLRLVEYDSSDESSTEPAEDSSVGEEPSFSVRPESESPEPSTSAEPEISSLLSSQRHQTCPGEHPLLRQVGSVTLDRAVLCLSELRQVVWRLQKKKLFPYDASSLLKLLTQVETCYRRSCPSFDPQ